jgi:hypothetical protein
VPYSWSQSLTDNEGRVENEDIIEVQNVMDIIKDAPAANYSRESTWFSNNQVNQDIPQNTSDNQPDLGNYGDDGDQGDLGNLGDLGGNQGLTGGNGGYCSTNEGDNSSQDNYACTTDT